MHNANVANSDRLKRTLKALRRADGEISSLELTMAAGSPAIGTCVSELRANGAEIKCRRVTRSGRPVWLYSLIKAPKGF